MIRSGVSAAISLGQRMLWRGRIYVIDGVDPMSVRPQHVHLRDMRTGQVITVDLAELEPPSRRGPT